MESRGEVNGDGKGGKLATGAAAEGSEVKGGLCNESRAKLVASGKLGNLEEVKLWPEPAGGHRGNSGRLVETDGKAMFDPDNCGAPIPGRFG